MKSKILLIIFVIGLSFTSYSQVPAVSLKDINGKSVNTRSITKMKRPVIVSFFATWCKPCLRELKAINEVYDEWQEETNVELIAVSIDNAQSADKVKSLVNGLGWEYSVWLDPNGDFKRALGVNLIPAIFVFDSEGKLAFSKSGYTEGSEEELIEKIKKLEAKK